MCLPQSVRFKVYGNLLVSGQPIVCPWPRQKFTVQLLRVSKDIFAEAAYCFYGKVRDPLLQPLDQLTSRKGNGVEELDADLDVSMSQDDEIDPAMSTALPNNVFQPMYGNQTLFLPPAPYLSLITTIKLSRSVPWDPSVLSSLRRLPNLALLCIGVGTYTADLQWDANPAACEQAVLDHENACGCFLAKCVHAFFRDGFETVEVVVKQVILREAFKRQQKSLEEFWADPDTEVGYLDWDATVDDTGHLELSARAFV